jgi:NAD(P)-dependent dehydrogenase (short-subunit alcohol dehydrogenase family)
MIYDFTGRVALVTGAASGIGRATALRLAADGAAVTVVDINAEGGAETVAMVEGLGMEAIFVKADVSLAADSERAVDETVRRFGKLDFAHNNAGVVSAGVNTDELTEEDFDRTFAVNVRGVWLGMRAQIRQMKAQAPVGESETRGIIVNTSSMRGLASYETQSAYSASKHAVIGLTKSAALEYARHGIRINAIAPGILRTPGNEDYWEKFPEAEADWLKLVPLGRYGTPEEIAHTVAWLCSDGASFVHGHALVADGGTLAE